MKEEHHIILDLIKSYLEQNPEMRFGQALFNLKINEFKKSIDPHKLDYTLRDIHNDSDIDIIMRIKEQLDWFNSKDDN